MRVQIVVDLGFGDSGKGLCVDYLVSKSEGLPLVVRFSGGHQVGHTVMLDGRRHTFSNYGAGTLRGAPTYYSEFCTLFPPAMLVEAAGLAPILPVVYCHPLALITTPFDVACNRALERSQCHGSCGVGFGATVKRDRDGVTLYAKDLEFSWVMQQKLRAIKDYYWALLQPQPEVLRDFEAELSGIEDDAFIAASARAREGLKVARLTELTGGFQTLLFEGSQGIMLDQKHGLFPNVTPSNTTTENAFHILGGIPDDDVETTEIFYVSRCYQTRHGNGPMSSTAPIELINNGEEANTFNLYQGHLRCTELDLDLLDYALRSDSPYHPPGRVHKRLLVTCLDQRPAFDWRNLLPLTQRHHVDIVLGSYGPTAEHVVSLSEVCRSVL
ncbi:MAG: adenylosuccinate synthetase [Pseudomonadota bacterium]|nr:adenylosuccinate synthetase [Pseudomonadota bacterium]